MIKKFLFTVFLGLSAFANSLTVGSNLPTLTVKDQFEKEFTIDAKIKTIIFSATKDESATIKDFLVTKDKNYLTTNNIAYVADITGMPSLISKFFALPKMKDYSFSILLIDEDNKWLTKEMYPSSARLPSTLSPPRGLGLSSTTNSILFSAAASIASPIVLM